MKNDDDFEDAHLNFLMTVLLIVAVVGFCAFALGAVYQLTQPWVAALIGVIK